jgi:hypothetical protein
VSSSSFDVSTFMQLIYGKCLWFLHFAFIGMGVYVKCWTLHFIKRLELVCLSEYTTSWTTRESGSNSWQRQRLLCPNWLWGPLSLLPNNYQALLPQEKSGQEVKLTSHFHIVVRLGKHRVIPSLLHISLWMQLNDT